MSFDGVHANADLIESLYGALGRRDGATMAACYAPDARFADPVFDLTGGEVGAMWTMLCARAHDIVVEWRDVRADDASGSGNWDARYTFAGTGRRVHNHIHSEFTFDRGRIATQRDTFDMRAWLRMAIGPVTLLRGMRGLFERRVRSRARRGLDEWIERHRGSTP